MGSRLDISELGFLRLLVWAVLGIAVATFVYLFRARSSGGTPLFVVVTGLAVNVVNAYINARSFPNSETTAFRD